MKLFLMQLSLCVVLLSTASRAYAQCVQLRPDVQRLQNDHALTPKQVSEQATALLATWQTCNQPVDTLFIKLLLTQGRAYLELGDFLAATQTFRRGCNGAYLSINRSLLAQASYLLGSAYMLSEQSKEAIKILLETVRQAIRYPADRSWGGQARVNLAYLNRKAGDYQQALEQVTIGLQWAEESKDNGVKRALLRERALTLYETGHYADARLATQQTISLAEHDRDPTSLSQYYQLQGDISSKLGQFELAAASYQTAMVYADQLNNTALKAVLLTNLGYLRYIQQQYLLAIQTYERALAIQPRPYSRARLYDNIGACWWKLGQFAKALTTYQHGFGAIPIQFNMINPVINPSPIVVRQILQKEYLLTLIQDKADTWLDYAKATNNKQRLRYALDTYKVADQMIDFMRWEHTGQQSKLYWRQKTRGMYERAIETCYLLNNTEQAFRFLEKSRAVMLADKLNELGARQQLAPQQIDQEQRLRQSVSDQQAKLAGLSPDSASYAPARTVLMTKQDSLDTFLKQLEASNPAYYRYKYDNTTTSLAALQQHLKKQQSSLVTYFVGDSALYVMGVTGDTVMLKKQPIAAYKQALNQFVPFLANAEAMRKMNDVRQFLVISNSLFRQLLAPLALPKGRVVVSPDGFFIPFDALSRSANRPDYAVNDYAFSYAYSASLLLKNGATKTRLPSFRTGDFLGVAPVDFAPALKQVMLSGSDKALTSIAERFDSPMLLTHKAATRRAFQQEAPGYPVVLLFTHATADSTDQEPMLYFTDSTLRLSDLGDKALPNAQLVVLAACKTGIGANQRGEGVFSLARGFSALGVPSVLTTLWSVENKATYQLTALFYKYLDDGFSKDIALQRAKQDWLKTADGANQLPNYWAGLIIVGDTEPLSHADYWLWIVVGIVLLLAGLGSWWYYRKRRIRQSGYAIA